MDPSSRAELDALMSRATRSWRSAGGDMPAPHSVPARAPSQRLVDTDDAREAHSARRSLLELPDLVLHRVCFLLDAPSARNLALTCSGLRDFAERRVWEYLDIFRLGRLTDTWTIRDCYYLTRLLLRSHPIRATFIRHLRLSWQYTDAFNKRDLLLLSHLDQAVAIDPSAPGKSAASNWSHHHLHGPGAEWRVVLNSFPTLPGCHSIHIDAYDEIGLDRIIKRLLDIAPSTESLCIEGRPQYGHKREKRPGHGPLQQYVTIPNRLRILALDGTFASSRAMIQSLLKRGPLLTELSVRRVSSPFPDADSRTCRNVAKVIEQLGRKLTRLTLHSGIIEHINEWPERLLELNVERGSDDHVTTADWLKRLCVPATTAGRIALADYHGDTSGIHLCYGSTSESCAGPDRDQRLGSPTCHPLETVRQHHEPDAVDEYVLSAVELNPNLAAVTFVAEAPGESVMRSYEISSYDRSDGNHPVSVSVTHDLTLPGPHGGRDRHVKVQYEFCAYKGQCWANSRGILGEGHIAGDTWAGHDKPDRGLFLPEES